MSPVSGLSFWKALLLHSCTGRSNCSLALATLRKLPVGPTRSYVGTPCVFWAVPNAQVHRYNRHCSLVRFTGYSLTSSIILMFRMQFPDNPDGVSEEGRNAIRAYYTNRARAFLAGENMDNYDAALKNGTN